MYLSKLEIHGFKSFADRTVVDFSSGVTAVVGPNGCGKSNIVDAVRWVIGEQRARILRSDKMDDIIFNGSSGRRSLGMSEVLLTIENDRGVLPIEYSEVTIGRRLFRSGESEYLLNGVQCRLKDITDLFMDTGMGAGAYSVIELKMIEDILSDSAGDRRHMFEEAAGISKYKTRRGQTLRKLAGTQTDLNRVRDLVDELGKRVRSLERQAKKASRFKRLDDRLNYVVLALAMTEYSSLSEEGSKLKNLISDSVLEVTRLTTQLAGLEATHESLRIEHIEKEQAVTSAQTRLVHHLDMLRQAESDLRLNKERVHSIERELTRAETDQVDADARSNHLQTDLATSLEKYALAVPAAEESATLLKSAREEKDVAENGLTRIRAELQFLAVEERRLLTDLAEHRRQIDRFGNRVELFEQDLEINAQKFKEAELGGTKLEKNRVSEDAAISEQNKRIDLCQTKLENAKESVKSKSLELKRLKDAHQDMERRNAALHAEKLLLESLLSSYDDLSESVQYLASSPDWSTGNFQTVSDLFACDREYQVVLDTALGEYTSCIVVRSKVEAERAIQSLKTNEKGRATFIISDRLDQSPPSSGESLAFDRSILTSVGAIPLSSVVRISEDNFRTLPQHLLYECFLIDDLDKVVAESPSFGRYFTRNGEWFDAAGFHHGGSPATGTSVEGSRMGRREHFSQVVAEIGKLETEINTSHKEIVEADTAITNIPADTLELELRLALEKGRELEKCHGQTEFEQSAVNRHKKDLTDRDLEIRRQQQDASAKIHSLQLELDRLETAVSEVRTQRNCSEKNVADLEEKNRRASSHFNEVNISAVETRNELELLARENARFNDEIERLSTETKRRGQHNETLTNQLSETNQNSSSLEIELTKLRKERNELDKITSSSKDVLSEVKVNVSDLEAELRITRREREEAMTGESRLSVRQAEIETRLNDLLDTMAEDYEIEISSYAMEIDSDFEQDSARTEIRDLRVRIRNLGPVNALALDSFEDEKKRFDFLQEQLEDLEHAENTLLTTIKEINETASARFDDTFSAIRSNFVKLFVELFGEEASADVILVNPNDPLESPIEVMARPRGKKLSVLAQLSGGEKTLTAIALLFAIYLVKPSPFCILDEVDAPLDDANVDRFMHMIRTFSESTQFILVTHNKRTMEAADCMYGVTMAEQGVSKLVGVKFQSELELVA